MSFFVHAHFSLLFFSSAVCCVFLAIAFNLCDFYSVCCFLIHLMCLVKCIVSVWWVVLLAYSKCNSFVVYDLCGSSSGRKEML